MRPTPRPPPGKRKEERSSLNQQAPDQTWKVNPPGPPPKLLECTEEEGPVAGATGRKDSLCFYWDRHYNMCVPTRHTTEKGTKLDRIQIDSKTLTQQISEWSNHYAAGQVVEPAGGMKRGSHPTFRASKAEQPGARARWPGDDRPEISRRQKSNGAGG